MTSCPTCGRTYEDETMRFCLDDGAPLSVGSSASGSRAPEPTLRMPAPVTEQPPTIRVTEPAMNLPGPPPAATAQFAASGGAGRGRGLLWLAVALIIGVSAIAVAYILTRRQPDVASVTPTVTSSPTANQSSSSPAPNSTLAAMRSGEQTNSAQVNRQIAQATPVIKGTPIPKPTPERLRTEPPTATNDAAPAAPRAPISGGVMNGRATHLVQPSYPPIAKAAHASGTVNVQVLIDENGNVVSAHATSGHPLLQTAAVNAARSSKFSPTKLSGQPVKVSGVIVYNFVAQ
ncbi:MAG: periplasmic protein TonB [Blastocatellia bacterium]|jgi:TonB family protein|nr:periplasmic protein TonB [Blastocatellia bacterium]